MIKIDLFRKYYVGAFYIMKGPNKNCFKSRNIIETETEHKKSKLEIEIIIEIFLDILLLSQPNNNHNPNPNNKTTKTVVGLGLSNHWEPPPPTTNSKLHDRAEIEQNSENKTYQSILGDPKSV